MPPSLVETILNETRKYWQWTNDIEITLEANPTSVEIQKFSDLRLAGVNRVSIGVQSLHDKDLKFLGRQHNSHEAISAIETAAKIFDRYNFDLIYARPQQSLKDWEAELQQALSLSAQHMSLYQLTIEPNTPFAQQYKRGDFKVLDNDLGGAFYEMTQDIMGHHGMPAYEISNHAVPEAESRHNLTYWRYGDYIGIGPGAHGRFMHEGIKYATRGHRAPDIWLTNVEEKGTGLHTPDKISGEDQVIECLMMGLRLAEGVPFKRLAQRDQNWRTQINWNRVKMLQDEGYLTLCDKTEKMSLTLQGMQRLNGILDQLLNVD